MGHRPVSPVRYHVALVSVRWLGRCVMARENVYVCGERSEMIEADQRNIRPVGVN